MSCTNSTSPTTQEVNQEVRELLHDSNDRAVTKAAHLRRLLLGRNPSPVFARMLSELNDTELLALEVEHREFISRRTEQPRVAAGDRTASVQPIKDHSPRLRYERVPDHILGGF